jgi:RNA polymerase sigma-70 factor (ECF subfamily)
VRLSRRTSPDQELRKAYEENVSAVYAFLAYSVSRDVAEDLTSATFERVVRSWASFDPSRSSVRAWVLVIARHLLIDHFRRQRHRAGPSLDEHPVILETLVNPDDPTARFIEADTAKSWLAELTQREREVLALRYGADMTAAEIARTLDVSEANVHQINSRALRRLRQLLSERPEIMGNA